MVRKILPEGVPADNTDVAFLAKSEVVPDTATPGFSQSNSSPNTALTEKADDNAQYRVVVVVEDEDDDEEEEAPKPRAREQAIDPHPHPPAFVTLILLLAIGAALIGIAGYVMQQNKPAGLPLCSSQPSWNQYDCRAG